MYNIFVKKLYLKFTLENFTIMIFDVINRVYVIADM